MSDFISRLLERSFAATSAVRPQLGSLFEPPPADGGAFFRGAENPELFKVEPQNQKRDDRLWQLQLLWHATPERAAPFVAALSTTNLTSAEAIELPSAASQIRPRVEAPKKPQRTMSSGSRRETAVPPKTAEETANALRPEVSSAGAQVRPSVDLPEKHQRVPPSNDGGRTADTPKTDKEHADVLRPQSPSERAASRSSVGSSLPRDSTKNPSHERRAEKTIELIAPERDADRELTHARNVHAVSQRSSSPRPLAPGRQPKNLPVAPSINVTIGRVEVRATLPPTPSKTTRSSAPILSLDEYLRQRAGGGRR